jgi:hypothetical protein
MLASRCRLVLVAPRCEGRLTRPKIPDPGPCIRRPSRIPDFALSIWVIHPPLPYTHRTAAFSGNRRANEANIAWGGHDSSRQTEEGRPAYVVDDLGRIKLDRLVDLCGHAKSRSTHSSAGDGGRHKGAAADGSDSNSSNYLGGGKHFKSDESGKS